MFKINDRVQVTNDLGLDILRRGDTGTIVKLHDSVIGQGKLASVKWDNPPRRKTSKIYLSRLEVVVTPAAFSVGSSVHLLSAFKSSPARTNGTVVSVRRADEAPTWLYRVRLSNGKTVKVYEDKLGRGSYTAPAPVATPTPTVRADNVVPFDRAAIDAAIAAAKPGQTVVIVLPAAA